MWDHVSMVALCPKQVFMIPFFPSVTSLETVPCVICSCNVRKWGLWFRSCRSQGEGQYQPFVHTMLLLFFASVRRHFLQNLYTRMCAHMCIHTQAPPPPHLPLSLSRLLPRDADGPETHLNLWKGIWNSLRVDHRIRLVEIPFPGQGKFEPAEEAGTAWSSFTGNGIFQVSRKDPPDCSSFHCQVSWCLKVFLCRK